MIWLGNAVSTYVIGLTQLGGDTSPIPPASFIMSLVFYERFQLVGRYADQNRWEDLNGPGDGRVTGEQFLQFEGVKGKWTEKSRDGHGRLRRYWHQDLRGHGGHGSHGSHRLWHGEKPG